MHQRRLISCFLIICLTFTQVAQAYSLDRLPLSYLINNKGDIGKTLNDMGQSQNVKALVTAMVTAGVLQGLNTTFGMEKVNAQSTFVRQLQKNLINDTAGAIVNQAINGGDLQSQLEQSIRTAFIDTGSAQGANWIGDMNAKGDLNAFTHQLAHAIAGCAAGAAKAGDCSSGALGAVVGEMSAELYGGSRTNSTNLDLPGLQTDTVNFAKMMAGIAVAITGGDATAINLGASAGGNAAENNYLSHWQQAAYNKEMQACTSAACKIGTSLRWGLTSVNQDAAMVTGMALGAGIEVKDAVAALAELPQTIAMLSTNPELLKGLPDGYLQGLQTTYNNYQTALESAGVDGATAAGVDFTHLVSQLALLPATVATGGAAAGYTVDKMAVLLDKIGTAAKTTDVAGAAANVSAAGANSGIGKVVGNFSAIEPGPLTDNLAGTFAGGRYTTVTLQNDTILYRAGTADQPLGQFFSLDPPTGVLQTRIDKAVLPEWPAGGTSPIDTYFAVKIPAGTQVHIGEVGTQNGFYIGGTQQVVVPKPWTIPDVQVINSSPLK
jgi:filamentous hemagglutinin